MTASAVGVATLSIVQDDSIVATSQQTVDSMIFGLNCKLGTEELNAMEKSAVKSKLQMMIKSLM